MKNTFRLLLLVLITLVAGCTNSAGELPTTAAESADDSATPTNRIDIPPTVRSNLGITFASVERRSVADTIRIPGAFELRTLARREYRLNLNGSVKLLVDQLEEVQAGDVLYRFQSPQWIELREAILAADQGVRSARAELHVARMRFKEAEDGIRLMDERIAARDAAQLPVAELRIEAAQLATALPRLTAEIDLAEIRLHNAESTHRAAMNQAAVATGLDPEELAQRVTDGGAATDDSLTWIDVRADSAGVVESINVTNGSFVESTTIVLTTIDPASVRFRASALQGDLRLLSDSAAGRLVPAQRAGTDLNNSVEATLLIGLEGKSGQRTVDLFATPVETHPWMKSGVAAFLEIAVDSSGGPALAIPRSAIVKDGITHVFFRRDPKDPNKVIRVDADLGPSDGRWVAINSGVMLNDEVVVDGAYELKLASEQSGISQQGGHFHADGTFHGDH